jgi:hypothetical protein
MWGKAGEGVIACDRRVGMAARDYEVARRRLLQYA